MSLVRVSCIDNVEAVLQVLVYSAIQETTTFSYSIKGLMSAHVPMDCPKLRKEDEECSTQKDGV